MPYRARIKVCGITRAEDAATAINEGVDALGLVFYEPSPRYVEPARAAAIAVKVPAFVDVVALFVDAPAERVRSVVKQVQPDLLQFHGSEEPAYCASFDRPYIKALRVRDESKLLQLAARYQRARALLLDSFQEGVPGGTGQTFNWDLIPPSLRKSIILAGGLDADNVAGAIRRLQPYAVDVSGGVERGKGIKDADKIRRFVQQVQAAGESI
jgi:phosphoribosylanthranilate isomerase